LWIPLKDGIGGEKRPKTQGENMVTVWITLIYAMFWCSEKTKDYLNYINLPYIFLPIAYTSIEDVEKNLQFFLLS
jgi:hypothetical protein